MVKSLHLPGNQLNGTIPASIVFMTSLGSLTLSSNNMSGALPSYMGNLTSMYWLRLGNNRLSGTIPSALGKLAPVLYEIYLNDNRFSGTIPTELAMLSRTEVLKLENNFLTGPIPSELGLLTVAKWMDFSGNGLNGTVPDSLGRLQTAEWLYFHDNNLTGDANFFCKDDSGAMDNNATCIDNFIGWFDILGSDCSWYEEDPATNCADAGLYGNFGYTANEACCACKSFVCVDVPGWYDLYGDNCSWYKDDPAENCLVAELYATSDGFSANEACCTCKNKEAASCIDVPSWSGGINIDCDLYASQPDYWCAYFGDSWDENTYLTANEACCACRLRDIAVEVSFDCAGPDPEVKCDCCNCSAL